MLTNHRAVDVSMDGTRISAVVIQSTETARQQRLQAKLFADCTGDAAIGYLAGADYEYEVANLMGSTNLFSVLDASDEVASPQV
ncbi:MAG: FAD-dependent oxidoreductase [Pirellulales bacterium]